MFIAKYDIICYDTIYELYVTNIKLFTYKCSILCARYIIDMRKLFSAGIPCQAGCKYCFAKWDMMYNGMPQLENEQISENEAIIYPCCDGEFFDQYQLIESVKRTAEKMDKVYLSISTKHLFNDEEVGCITKLNQELVSANKGFVKLAISLSNMTKLEDIEPDTMSYSERLDLARRIKDADIFLAITIKPILPFVTAEEYCQIIDDFSKYTKYFLIGGLYINRESDFYSKYISSQNIIQHRTVEWLPNHPEWEYIEDAVQFQKIRLYADNKGVFVFNSDVDLIKAYIRQRC